MSRKAIYPGTFDPITLGHLDVIKKASKICDELIIAVAVDTPKKTLFSGEERAEMITKSLREKGQEKNIKVIFFSGLLVDFAKNNGCEMIIRGLRAVSDFEFEFQLASMNSRLDSDIQTVFIPASENSHFIASRLVKEVARLGGDISSFVSENVERKVQQRINSENN